MESYENTLKFLNSFTNYEKIGFDCLKEEFNLDKLKKVLKAMKDPQLNYRTVHVAGTKGKGSVCTFVSSILTASGYKVGLFTSPHITDFSERIKINAQEISNEDLEEIVEEIKKYIGPDPQKKFTYFEIITLIAILYFSFKKVDFAVFEVGLGGRLDATNVISPEVCGISPISYDHMGILGSDIKDIAQEKAGIIKEDVHCVVSYQKPSVLNVIASKCAANNASMSLVGKDISCEVKKLTEDGSVVNINGQTYNINMPGRFQAANCALAVGICEKLLGKLDQEKVKRGIRAAFIPGRMEVIAKNPLLILDGAQNVDSAENLKESIEQIFKYDKLVLLLGFSKDKDIRGVCNALKGFADEIILTKASNSRGADAHLVRGYFKGREIKVTKDTKEALGIALSLANKRDLILATGSFYVVAEIRKLVLGEQ